MQVSRNLLIVVVVIGALGAVLCPAECPVGDLDGDCTVGFGDVRQLAIEWLNSNCESMRQTLTKPNELRPLSGVRHDETEQPGAVTLLDMPGACPQP